jgi:SAM-dependent methyltransferase
MPPLLLKDSSPSLFQGGTVDYAGCGNCLTAETYVGFAPGYEDRTVQEVFRAFSLNQFNLLKRHGLTKNSYVVDIGCGTLRLATRLIPFLDKGHYCGIEPSLSVLKHGLNCNLPCELKSKAPRFISENYDFPVSVFGTKFDFAMLGSVFSHASIGQIGTCLDHVKPCLTDGGLVLASVVDYRRSDLPKGIIHEERPDWTYPHSVVHSKATMESVASEHGFVVSEDDWPHVCEQMWLTFRAAA